LRSGRLPGRGAPGTSGPTRSDVLELTDATQAEAHPGNLTTGGVLAESGATGVKTTNADSVDESFAGHFNDAGVPSRRTPPREGSPNPPATRCSLLPGSPIAPSCP
jgi:hypothetical protein